MKILVLSSRLPHARGKADSMTVYRLVRYLAQYHRVALATFFAEESELRYLPDLKECCEVVECIPLRKCVAAWNTTVVSTLTGWPLQTAYYYDARMQRMVDRIIDQFQPDVAYSHLIRTAEYLKDYKSVTRVLALQISQTLNYRRMVENISSPYYRLLYGIEYSRVRKYEPEIMKEFDSCLMISRFDKESLDGHEAIDNVFYSPHGVDVEYFRRKSRGPRERMLLFCGVLETPTNVDAIMYFYREIYPLVKRLCGPVNLYLVGKNPPSSITRLAERDESVIVTGYVNDVRPYYARARVGIDPLRIGAGMQNKLLVGMCMELPMVCTTIANEGIGAEPGKELLVGDDPEKFAECCALLMEDDDYHARIAQNARWFVEDQWTWEYHFEALNSHLIRLVSNT